MSRNQDDEATQQEKLDEAADKAQQVAEILDEVRAGNYSPDEQAGGEGGPTGGASEQTPGNGSKISPI
ncbi:MAG TPA: hypothetical protein VK363_00815 [Pyrinomonadaceae bacterium]|nr:hypothetical protein [Pyrinomonadaceae bacterium]